MKTIQEIKLETGKPVVVADQNGAITEVNERFTAVFGWTPEEIVGKPLATLIPKKLRDTHRLGFSRFLRSGRAVILNQPLDLKALTKDGREVSARHFIVAERVDAKWMFAASIELLG
jgi:PAS domain S-box-containing protein